MDSLISVYFSQRPEQREPTLGEVFAEQFMSSFNEVCLNLG